MALFRVLQENLGNAYRHSQSPTPRVRLATGYGPEDVLRKLCSDNFLMCAEECGCLLCDRDCPPSHTMQDGHPRRSDVFIHHKSGHRIPLELRVSPIRAEDGTVVGVVGSFNDNSRQRAVRERAKELTKLAFLDLASKIGNRRYSEQRLSQQLDQHFKSGDPLGIMLADLDEFKKINDTYGHAAGDVARLTVARTLSNCLRGSDVVARWGGDEFLATLPGITREALAKASQKIRALVARSTVAVDGTQISVTISLGAAMAPGDSPQPLLKRADQLLYASKQAGRNRVTL